MANPPSLTLRPPRAGLKRKQETIMKLLTKIISKRTLYAAVTIGAAVAASGAGLKWN
jgi:hypothetical protein